MRFCRDSSLEEFCLHVIVANFDNFHLHYDEKYNNFLRRFYSDKIYHLLRKTALLTDEHTNWLLSPYWKDVKLSRIQHISDTLPKFLHYGKDITSLSLGFSLTPNTIICAIVCLIPQVKSLNLNHTNCGDDTLLLIRKMCPELISLNLSGCRITSKGMENLCCVNDKNVGFDSLKELNVLETRVDYKGVRYVLENIKLDVFLIESIASAVYCLYHSEGPMVDGVFEGFELKQFHYDIETDTKTVSFENILKLWIRFFPKIEKLHILKSMTDCRFELCSKFQNLKSFKYSEGFRNGIPNNSLMNFIEFSGKKLTELVIEKALLSVETIARVCHNLKKLVLFNIAFQDFNPSDMCSRTHHLNCLTELKIRKFDMHISSTYASIESLLSMPKILESLIFAKGTAFPNEFVEYIIDLQYLTKVRFEVVDIQDSAAVKLFTCKHIRELQLDYCAFVQVEKHIETFTTNHVGNSLAWRIDFK